MAKSVIYFPRFDNSQQKLEHEQAAALGSPSRTLSLCSAILFRRESFAEWKQQRRPVVLSRETPRAPRATPLEKPRRPVASCSKESSRRAPAGCRNKYSNPVQFLCPPVSWCKRGRTRVVDP